MALIIYNSAFEKGKMEASANVIIDKAINNNNLNDFLLIVPTGKLTKHLKYGSIEKYYKRHNKPCGDISVYNLERFANLISDKLFSNSKYRKLSEPYRLALIDEAATLLRDELKFYKIDGKKFYYSVIERLANIIYGLREDGITYQNMFEELEQANENTIIKDINKFSDIAKIFAKYESLLADKYIDPPKLIGNLISLANDFALKNSDGKSSAFDDVLHKIKPNISQIAVYGFSEFKEPEIEFLSKFSFSAIPLSIHLDFSETNGPLFGNLQEMKMNLITAGFNSYYTEDEVFHDLSDKDDDDRDSIHLELAKDDNNKTPKYFLRRWLFNVEKETEYSTKDLINIYEFETFNDEITNISKLIKHLILNEGYKPFEIAIVSRNISSYSTKLRENFYIEKIPANFSDRYSLAESQIVITILSILNTMVNNYRYSDVVNLLQSPFIEFTNGEKTLNKSNFLQVINELRFSKFNFNANIEYWRKRFDNAIAKLKVLLEKLDSESTDEFEKSNLERRIKNYEQARADFDLFVSLIPEKQDIYTPNEFKELVIDKIINKFNFSNSILNIYKDNLEENSKKTKFERDIENKTIEKYARALSEFIKIVEEMVMIMKDRGRSKSKLADFADQLRLIVSGAKYQTRDKQNYGVTVTSIEQIREIPFKVTILCGLNDGEFPASYRPESFLGKELRDSEDRHLHSEQVQFYQFLINGLEDYDLNEKKIFLSYSKYQDNYEVTRSSFVDSLLKVTNATVVEFSDKSKVSNLKKEYPWFDSISNRLELSEYIGKNHFNSQAITNENPAILSYPKYEDINSYFQSISEVFNKIKDNNFALLDVDKYQKALLPKDNIYSASNFELFTDCGYKYYVDRVLKIKAPDKQDDIIDHRDFGNIMHSALFKFYSKLQENSLKDLIVYKIKEGYDLPDIKPVSFDESQVNEYTLLLSEIIEREFDEVKFDHPYIKLSKRDTIRKDKISSWARMFIEADVNRISESFPSLFEFSFGMQKTKVPPIQLKENLFLRGKIDRVEFTPNKKVESSEKEDIYFLIADYKSTAKSAKNDKAILDGTSFQTALYILAMQKILPKYYDLHPITRGASYYILKPKASHNKKENTYSFKDNIRVLMPQELDFANKKPSPSSKLISNTKVQQALLDQALTNATNIIEKITRAEFDVKPKDKNTCKYCSFQPICRISERQLVSVEEDEDTNFDYDD